VVVVIQLGMPLLWHWFSEFIPEPQTVMHDSRISSGVKHMSPQLVNDVLNETSGH